MKKQIKLLIFVFTSTIFISSCGSRTFGEVREEVWLSPFNFWNVKHVWVFNAQETRDVLPYVIHDIDSRCQSFNREKMQKCQWKQHATLSGGSVVIIEVTGRGLDELNIAAFDGRALIIREDGYVTINLAVPIDYLRYYSLTLYAGPIVSSNANRSSLISANWENPQAIEAKIINGNLLGLLIVSWRLSQIFTVVIAALIVAIILFLLRRIF